MSKIGEGGEVLFVCFVLFCFCFFICHQYLSEIDTRIYHCRQHLYQIIVGCYMGIHYQNYNGPLCGINVFVVVRTFGVQT